MSKERQFWMLVIASITIWIFAAKGCTKLKVKNALSQIEELENARISDALIVKKWKDSFNHEHTVAQELIVDNIILSNENKEQARLLGIKPKQIQGKTSFTTDIDTFVKFDTLYKDNYVFFELKKETLHFSLKDTFVETHYWKRSKILFLPIGSKQHYVDLSNRNPYVHIDKISIMTAKAKTPTFILGGGLSFNPFSKQLIPSITLLYYPFCLKF